MSTSTATDTSSKIPNVCANTLGMEFVAVVPGTFSMGQEDGDTDERPEHRVKISRAFAMATTPVTNAQYEAFDPAHRALRGIHGFSSEDSEAVVNVSWLDAVAFCDWLSKREGTSYRLPTEAEWEYACRAGTTTPFHTGEQLPEAWHRCQELSWDPKLEWNLKPVPLHVGKTPANPWGLHDMHGLVEEWCLDWYGPYQAKEQADPVGYSEGDCRVTRGGSHNTPLKYLRSANRSAALPEDKHWRIGFRVVHAPAPVGMMLPAPKSPRCMQDVTSTPFDWGTTTTREAVFKEPIPFVVGTENELKSFNHCPSITWCDNGDLLACWFSTEKEEEREMVILASRLRVGADSWEPASLFFDVADRNLTGSALFNNGQGKIYHFNGVETGETWAALALMLRTSTDCGRTWSRPRLINPHHQPRNQVIASTTMTQNGAIIQPCDAVHGGCGGTAIHISHDGGLTWEDPGAGSEKQVYSPGNRGGTIAGIHASVVELKDGRLLALGRGNSRFERNDNIAGTSPMSISEDGGRTWIYSSSPFGVINSGQRSVLMRLREGPLMVVTFTDPKTSLDNPSGAVFKQPDGDTFLGFGMYAALSFDEGLTWPLRRLLTAGDPRRRFDGRGWTRFFWMDATHAEPKGYLAATQTPDGIIHLVSSGLHYRFNLEWLKVTRLP